MRNFMLDEPRTLGMAERLTTEFKDLQEAHAAVVDTRNQRDVLQNAKGHWNELTKATERLAQIEAEKAALPYWSHQTEIELQTAERVTQQRKLETTIQALEIAAAKTLDQQNAVDTLRLRRNESGGLALERLQNAVNNHQEALDKAQRHAAVAQNHAKNAKVALPKNADDWLAFRESLTRLIDSQHQKEEALRGKRDELVAGRAENEKNFRSLVVEIESMQAHPNNIPAKNLEMRADLARAIGVEESDLPFVGELIEVKADQQADWQGAIERVLHNFALSILVDDKLYAAFTDMLEKRKLHGRLVYYRVRGSRRDFDGNFRPRSLPTKLNIQTCRWEDWLAGELDARFSYLCADTLEEFRKADQAVTRAGQIKHNAERHEKDDRRDISDPRGWVTGFSNAEKLKLLEDDAAKLGEKIASTAGRISKLLTDAVKIQGVIAAANALLNTDWADIDVGGLRAKLASAQAELTQLLEHSSALKAIDEQLEQAGKLLAQLRQKESDLTAQRTEQQRAVQSIDERLAELEQLLERLRANFVPQPRLIDAIDDRATDKGKILITLKNLQNRREAVSDSLWHANQAATGTAAGEKARVIEQFNIYLTRWPTATAELDASLDSANDFFLKLDNIEKDGLPRHEQRFRELLETQSLEHFAELNQEMRQARQEILERMEEVNLSLSQAAFSRLADGDSHLVIEVKDLKLAEVDEFRGKLSQLIQGAWDDQSIEEAERRFQMIETLATDLDPANRERERWRKLVLDVRSHVSFTANEVDGNGNVLESYFSGSGKSGGQRQKLTTTCLAAALCYQLSSGENGKPIFAPVILDEAFDKADSEFTDISMNIFRNFDFQMIVATPEKSVVTLEPYIGGAYYVVMEDRKHSAGLNVRYNDELGKLDLKDLYPTQTPDSRPDAGRVEPDGQQPETDA